MFRKFMNVYIETLYCQASCEEIWISIRRLKLKQRKIISLKTESCYNDNFRSLVQRSSLVFSVRPWSDGTLILKLELHEFTETMLSFWRHNRHWLHRKLSKWQLLCSQWRRRRQNDDVSVSVITWRYISIPEYDRLRLKFSDIILLSYFCIVIVTGNANKGEVLCDMYYVTIAGDIY